MVTISFFIHCDVTAAKFISQGPITSKWEGPLLNPKQQYSKSDFKR